MLNIFIKSSIKNKQTNMCSKSTIKTQGDYVKCIKVKYTSIRTTSMTCLYC